MDRRHVLCFGDSNTWGYRGPEGGRFDDDTRWTMRMAGLLGSGYLVIEEGLSGRTTCFEDPLNEGLSGLAVLTPVLRSHAPLDLLIVMLGTNDCKQRFAATPVNIRDGLLRLVNKARGLDVWRADPRILIVAPVVIDGRLDASVHAGGMGEGCVEKSRRLPALFEQMAAGQGLDFFDCNPFVTPAEGDFMHFDEPSHARFAEALAGKVREILG